MGSLSLLQAPITKCHILSDLTVEIYFLLALEAGSPQDQGAIKARFNGELYSRLAGGLT